MPFLAAISAGFTTSRVVLPGTGSGGGGGGGGSFTWGGDRGLVAGGTGGGQNVIQYFDITTTGNAQDFGDLNFAPTRVAGLSNGTRAVFGGGFNGSTTYYDNMDYITVATTGNAQNLGDLSQERSSLAGASDATTGIFAGGSRVGTLNSYLDIIDSFTIATTGDATDFGNLTQGRSLIAGWNNSTRAVFAGGDPDGATQSNVMDYITIASAGDATDFGDMTDSWNRAGGSGDATYALFAGGRRAGSVNANGWTENIDYVTVATTGNATDFGDLTTFKDNVAGNSNGTRATFSGGSTNDGSNVSLNNIDYVTVATPGNATDFGDLLAVNESAAATSGSAGGGGGVSLNMYGDRGVHWTGRPSTGSYSNVIDYIDISTPGNATDFGDYTSGTTRHMSGGASNGSRGVFHGGALSGSQTNELHYITFASPGNSTDFGDLNNVTDNTAGSSDETRGLFWHGRNNKSNIDYITIGTTGNATDFGSATYTDHETGALSGPTRNFGFGGLTTANNNSIEYVTVQTLASATDFGDLSIDVSEADGAGDATRGIIALGTTYTSTGNSTTYIDNLEYITQDTPGNSTDFGDLTTARGSSMCNSNGTTMTIAGGTSPTTNTIDYVTIQTTSNATDFGDLTVARYYGGAASGSAS